MKKLWLAGLTVMAMMAATGIQAVEAQDKDKAEAKGKVAEKDLQLQDMVVTGTVVKKENKKKDGSPLMTWFRLVDESGAEIGLPKGKIEEFVGCKVKVTGQGYTIEKKNKSLKTFKTISAIEKLEEVAPAGK